MKMYTFLQQGRYHAMQGNDRFYGLIDITTEKWVIPPTTYTSIKPIGNGYWEAKQGYAHYLINPETGWVSKNAYRGFLKADEEGFWVESEYMSEKSAKYGDWEEYWVYYQYNWDEERTSNPYCIRFIRGALIVIECEGKIGVADKDFNILLEPAYVSPSWEGPNENDENYQYYIELWKDNKCGWFKGENWVVPPEYNAISMISKGVLVGFKEKGFTIFNEEGQSETYYEFEEAYQNWPSIFSRTIKNYFYNKNLKKIPLLGDVQEYLYRNDAFAIIKPNGKYDLIDHSGNPIIIDCDSISKKNGSVDFYYKKNEKSGIYYKDCSLFEFENSESIVPLNETIFAIKRHGKWGIINNFKEFIFPAIYEDYRYRNIFLFLKYDGQWSIYNQKFQKLQTDEMNLDRQLNDSYLGIWLKKNNKWGLFDGEGNESLPVNPLFINEYPNFEYYRECVAYPNENKKWGMIRSSDKQMLIPFEYDKIIVTGEIFYAIKDKKIVLFSEQFEVTDEFIGDEIDFFDYKYYKVRRGNIWYFIDGMKKAEFTQPYLEIKYGRGAVVCLARRVNNIWDCIDVTGKIILSFESEKFYESEKFEIIYIEKHGKKIYYDLMRKKIIS